MYIYNFNFIDKTHLSTPVHHSLHLPSVALDKLPSRCSLQYPTVGFLTQTNLSASLAPTQNLHPSQRSCSSQSCSVIVCLLSQPDWWRGLNKGYLLKWQSFPLATSTQRNSHLSTPHVRRPTVWYVPIDCRKLLLGNSWKWCHKRQQTHCCSVKVGLPCVWSIAFTEFLLWGHKHFTC